MVKYMCLAGEQFLSLFDSSDSDDVGNRDDETQDAVETRGLEDTSVHNDEKKMGVSMNVKDQQKTRKHGKEMHDVDAIFTTNKSAPSGGGGGGDSTSTGKRKSKIGNSSRGNKTKEAPAKGCEEHEEEERRRRRMEKRRFMASKPDRILSDEPTVNHRNSRRIERKEKQSDREEFKAMAREIQSFGMLG